MNRLGMWSAYVLVVLGAAYAVVVVVVLVRIHGRPVTDPTLAIMELLTLATAPLLVLLMAAVHAAAPPGSRAFSAAALAFVTILAGVTSTVHFIELTALRQMRTAGLAWPSVPYAAELLAWDVFLGLSLLCAAPVYRGAGLRRAVRICMLVTGGLCIAGVLGPATGDMRLQLVAVVAYCALLPITFFFVGQDFRRAYRAERPGPPA